MRTWIFTPCFAKSQMLADCLEHLYEDKSLSGNFHHVVLDNHYPVNQKENSEQIQKLCKHYDCIYVDSLYDRGLHDSLNHGIKIVDVKETDIFMGCDPDDRPEKGWAQALKSVMTHDPTMAVCGMNFWVLPWKMKEQGLQMRENVIGGQNVWIHPGVEMWNVAAFNMKLIFAMGGFSQPNAYYGGLEIALHRNWVPMGMRMGYLKNLSSEIKTVDRDNPLLFDKEYGNWKIAHAQNGYTKSFGCWLRSI